eukprot:738984-Rhodomonas_salina.1
MSGTLAGQGEGRAGAARRGDAGVCDARGAQRRHAAAVTRTPTDHPPSLTPTPNTEPRLEQLRAAVSRASLDVDDEGQGRARMQQHARVDKAQTRAARNEPHPARARTHFSHASPFHVNQSHPPLLYTSPHALLTTTWTAAAGVSGRWTPSMVSASLRMRPAKTSWS